MTKREAQYTAAILNEKAVYKYKAQEWKKLRVRGDIQAIADMTKRSTVLISRAVNNGKGSLFILRTVEKYFDDRKKALNGETPKQ